MLLFSAIMSACISLTTTLPISTKSPTDDNFLDKSNIGFVPDTTEGAIINSEVLIQTIPHPDLAVHRTRKISSDRSFLPPTDGSYLPPDERGQFIGNRIDDDEAPG